MKYLKYSLRFGLLSMLILAACSDGDDSGLEQEQEEVNTVATYDTSNILAKFEGTGLSYAINGNTVTFTTADLPNHTSPYWDASNPLYEVYNGNNDNWNKILKNCIPAVIAVYERRLKHNVGGRECVLYT